MEIRGSNKSDSGMSLIELMIVITIIGLVSTFALIALADSQTHLDRQNIARQFKNSLERARFDSVKRNVSTCADMSRVVIENATAFTVLVDLNNDGTLTPEYESRTVDFSDPNEVAIVYDLGQSFPITIRFDRRGNSSSGTCGAETGANSPTIFCNVPCSTISAANEKNSNVVYVSPTGTTAYLTGGSSIPTLSAPTIAVLDNSSQINPGLAVWDIPSAVLPSPTASIPVTTPSPTSTSSPTPTDTPISSPTASPNPAGTVSPAPSGSPASDPTPTPASRYCLLGETPAINVCICSPLQYLQASTGKCRAL